MSKKVTMANPKSEKARLDIRQVFAFCSFLFLAITTNTRKFPPTVKRRSGMEIPVMTKGNASIYKKKIETF